ncbi:type II secretion system protein [Candidatus Uhrbacteria bacterium]|nr:type II secretion system protein [Candidatus Uhrbacteria bacterium]
MTGVKITRRPGFTLLEMLLVVLIFSLASAALAQIFVNITRLQRKISNQAVLSQDMRFATEMLTRAGRNNYIDYTAQPLDNRSDTLTLTKPTGGSITITTKDSATCNDPKVNKCIMLSMDGGLTWNPVTSHRVDVTNFDVYVRPLSSPFTDTSINQQPMVTVNIGLTYMADKPADRVSLQTQATVSSRLYQR